MKAMSPQGGVSQWIPGRHAIKIPRFPTLPAKPMSYRKDHICRARLHSCFRPHPLTFPKKRPPRPGLLSLPLFPPLTSLFSPIVTSVAGATVPQVGVTSGG